MEEFILKRIILTLFAICISICGYPAVHARGAVPPPPPFSGGNAGAWLGHGPVFGFDDGGGPGGGWGGAWYDGGWGGWGSGSGGGGYTGGGGGRHNGMGDAFDPDTTKDLGGLHGTCFVSTPVGGYYECSCSVPYDPLLPPCDGCPVHGVCRATGSDLANSVCQDQFDICTGNWK